jgi:hypothetical protein
MSLKKKVAELRKSVRSEFEATSVVLDRSMLIAPADKAKRLAAMEKTMAKVDAVLDHILSEKDAEQLGLAERAVTMTVNCWRDAQDAAVPTVGVA